MFNSNSNCCEQWTKLSEKHELFSEQTIGFALLHWSDMDLEGLGSEYFIVGTLLGEVVETLNILGGSVLGLHGLFSDKIESFLKPLLDLTEADFGEPGGEAVKFIWSFTEILFEALLTRFLVASLALLKAPRNELDIFEDVNEINSRNREC